ncbi:hypothetical protein C8R45DRAFT_966989 [Mycena sanguinolenta]|nr:hypothetical protein C8R45DRAFT_966989 [Mycena sanguinolenta]
MLRRCCILGAVAFSSVDGRKLVDVSLEQRRDTLMEDPALPTFALLRDGQDSCSQRAHQVLDDFEQLGDDVGAASARERT